MAADRDSPKCTECEPDPPARLAAPPVVPDDFWAHPPLLVALKSAHIGHVLRAYRLHPWHGLGRGGLTQSTVGVWLGLSQAQVSRIENGPPRRDRQWLTSIAEVLAIPAQLLWFHPDHSPATVAPSHGIASLRVVGSAAKDSNPVPVSTCSIATTAEGPGEHVPTVRLDVLPGATVAITVENEAGPVRLLVVAHSDPPPAVDLGDRTPGRHTAA
jgi:helix-turn-helix protein